MLLFTVFILEGEKTEKSAEDSHCVGQIMKNVRHQLLWLIIVPTNKAKTGKEASLGPFNWDVHYLPKRLSCVLFH